VFGCIGYSEQWLVAVTSRQVSRVLLVGENVKVYAGSMKRVLFNLLVYLPAHAYLDHVFEGRGMSVSMEH